MVGGVRGMTTLEDKDPLPQGPEPELAKPEKEKQQVVDEREEMLRSQPPVFLKGDLETILPELFDIPTQADDGLTPFQRGLKILAEKNKPEINLREKFDPKGYEKMISVVEKEKAEEQRLERIIEEALENKTKLEPETFKQVVKEYLKVDDEDFLKRLTELYESTDIKSNKANPEVFELLVKFLGDSINASDPDWEKKSQETDEIPEPEDTPFGQVVEDFEMNLSEASFFAPELVNLNTIIKGGLVPPLVKTQKKINRYNAWKIRAAAKVREKLGESGYQKKKKAPLDVQVGIQPNAMRYVDPNHPRRLDLEEFAYAIGFNKSWTEEDKKRLVEQYAKMLKTPIPDTEEFKEHLWVNSTWRFRNEAQRRSQFEEMYNEEIQKADASKEEDD